MRILLNQIEEISTGTIDKPDDSLEVKLLGGFKIIIETTYVPCLSIQATDQGVFLTIDD